jgi:hypothetical protein
MITPSTIVTAVTVPPVNMVVQTPAPVQVFAAPTIVFTGDLPLESPKLTGIPEAPTAAPGTATGQLATTEFVDKATRFIFTQLTPSLIWEVNHNMNKYPTYIAIESGGEQVVGDLEYKDLNTLILTFSAAISGKMYLV